MAVERYRRNLGLSVGVHLDITVAIQHKWRPAHRVYATALAVFFTTEELIANNTDPEEVEREFRAQVKIALKRVLCHLISAIIIPRI